MSSAFKAKFEILEVVPLYSTCFVPEISPLLRSKIALKCGLADNLWVHFNNSWPSPENLFEPDTPA